MEKPNNEQEFLVNNEQLKNINLPNIKQVGDKFLSDSSQLVNIELPQIDKIPKHPDDINFNIPKGTELNLEIPNINEEEPPKRGRR